MTFGKPKCHTTNEAQEFGGEVSKILPARATGDDLRRAAADPAMMRRLTQALDEVLYPPDLPRAVVDQVDGGVADIVLLADVCSPVSKADWVDKVNHQLA